MAFFQNPDEVTLAVGQGILDSPSALTRQAIAVLCGDPDAMAGFVMGYGTFVLGGLAGPSVARSFRALATVGDEARFLPLADDLVPCVNSFSADTPVATPDGTTPIGDIRVGDVVRGYDEATGTTGSFTVTAVISHTDLLVLDLTLDNETLTTTPEHPFYAMLRGWTDAEDLRTGDSVRRLDGTYGRVNETIVVRKPQVMYNLTVATAHTFFVGGEGWLVHNTYRCFPEGSPSSTGISLAAKADALYVDNLGFWEKKHTTIAVTELDGITYVTVNGDADTRAIPKIDQAATDKGWVFIPNHYGKTSHAEKFLYEYLNSQPTHIGISHRKGPCPEICKPFFENLGVEIKYNNDWK